MSHRCSLKGQVECRRLDQRRVWPFRVGKTCVIKAGADGYPLVVPTNGFEFMRRAHGRLQREF